MIAPQEYIPSIPYFEQGAPSHRHTDHAEYLGRKHNLSGGQLPSNENSDWYLNILSKDIRFFNYDDVAKSAFPDNPLRPEFETLTDEWKKETGFHSSLSEKFMHPAYQRIMAMGKPALPLILHELEHASGYWFYALRFIAGKDIADGTRSMTEARNAWIKWGRDKANLK
ncbi:hypothetical protein BH20VER3_BH20VER3_08820 [soil metagenome]